LSNQIKLGIKEWALPVEGPWGCKIAAEIGFEGIQLDVGSYQRNFSKTKRCVQDAYLEAAAKYGIQYTSIDCNELDAYNMVAPKGFTERAIAFKTIIAAIDAAAAMKIPNVMVQSFKASALETEQDIERAIKVLRQISDYALEKGDITIGLENLLSVEDLLRVIDEVGNPNVKIYFDTQNYYLDSKVNVAAMVESLISHICQVHVKDGYEADIEPSGALLGQGDTGFFDTIAELRRCGYSGWLISENFYDRGPIGKLSDDPIELIAKDFQVMKSVAW
jgi:sugar phosphate isomerase/epimerase